MANFERACTTEENLAYSLLFFVKIAAFAHSDKISEISKESLHCSTVTTWGQVTKPHDYNSNTAYCTTQIQLKDCILLHKVD